MPADPVDAVIWHELGTFAPPPTSPIAVIDDPTGDLSVLIAQSTPAQVRVYCDSLVAERDVAARAQQAQAPVTLHHTLDEGLLAGVHHVVLRLPKSLGALDDIATSVARWAEPDATLVAGGRIKHLSRGMNEVLGRSFETVYASLGRRKSRALVAVTPTPVGTRECTPLTERHDDVRITVASYGGTFAGAGIDLGSRLLLSALDLPVDAREVVDLGCGTGVLAVAIAMARPSLVVHAVDESSAAVRSARATAEVNGVADRVLVRRADRLEGIPAQSLDAVLCNPPFHRGTAKDTSTALAMIEDAARALRPGGELWLVFNSHLPYLPTLRRRVGRTEVMAQSPGFIVTRSRAPRRTQGRTP